MQELPVICFVREAVSHSSQCIYSLGTWVGIQRICIPSIPADGHPQSVPYIVKTLSVGDMATLFPIGSGYSFVSHLSFLCTRYPVWQIHGHMPTY